jgi:LemA protein
VEIVVVLVIVAALALFFIATYNRLVTLRQRVKEAWADIDVQLKRRHDLIPNLVETVKGYATHESSVFQKVTEARAAAVAAGASGTPAERAQAENMLTGALSRLFSDVEQYPDLKAEGDFQRLEHELADLERILALSRDAYNMTVQGYNNTVETFPSTIVAWFADFEKKEYLVTGDAERAVPGVDVDVPAVPPMRTAV